MSQFQSYWFFLLITFHFAEQKPFSHTRCNFFDKKYKNSKTYTNTSFAAFYHIFYF